MLSRFPFSNGHIASARCGNLFTSRSLFDNCFPSNFFRLYVNQAIYPRAFRRGMCIVLRFWYLLPPPGPIFPIIDLILFLYDKSGVLRTETTWFCMKFGVVWKFGRTKYLRKFYLFWKSCTITANYLNFYRVKIYILQPAWRVIIKLALATQVNAF